jgi:hypothetical protein
MFVKLLNLLLNMKTTTKLLSILFLIMLIQSCDKDTVPFNKEPLKTYYYLAEWQLNQTPYFTNPAFDTISFASDKGDSLTFVKTKTDTTWYCERNSNNPSNSNQDCYQTIHNSYSIIKGVGSFDVKHSRKISYKDLTDIISLQFNNIYFLCSDIQIGYNGYWTFKKEVTLKNRNFYDAIVLYPNSYDSLTAECFINKFNGLFYLNNKINQINYTILN